MKARMIIPFVLVFILGCSHVLQSLVEPPVQRGAMDRDDCAIMETVLHNNGHRDLTVTGGIYTIQGQGPNTVAVFDAQCVIGNNAGVAFARIQVAGETHNPTFTVLAVNRMPKH